MASLLSRAITDIRRRLGPGLLRTPVAVVADELGASPGATAMLALARLGMVESLEQLASDPLVISEFDDRLGADQRAAILRELDRWAREKESPGSPRRTDAPDEHVLPEIVQWARAEGLDAYLKQPIRVLAPHVVGADPWVVDELARRYDVDVAAAASGRGAGRGLRARTLAAAARAYLEEAREEERYVAQRAVTWSREPTSPVLARIAGPLRDLEARWAPHAGRLPRLALVEVQIDPSIPALVTRSSQPSTLYGYGEATLSLAGHERGIVTLESRTSTERAVALLRIARDAVHDPAHALHAPLIEALSVPGWQRMIEAIDHELEPERAEAREARRVVLRIGCERDGTPKVEPYLQKLGARGRWSKGTRARGTDLGHVRLAPELAHAIRAIDANDPAGALHAVAGAGVTFDEDGAPVDVRRVEARFALADDERGPCAALAIGPLRIPVEQVVARIGQRSGCVAHVDGAIAYVATIDETLAAVVRAAGARAALIPSGAGADVLPALERIAAKVPVALPPSLESAVALVEPAILVRIVPDEEGAIASMRVRISRSATAPAGLGSELVSTLVAGSATPVLRRRDLAAEEARAEALARELGWGEETVHGHALRSGDAIAELLERLAARPEIEVEWPEPRSRMRFVGSIGRSGLSVAVKSAAEWFGVDGEVVIDGETVRLAELLAEIRAGRRFVRLSRGRFAAIEKDLRSRLERAADVVFETGRGAGLAIVPAAGDAIEALVDDLEVDTRWARMRERIARGALADPDVPAGLVGELRSYQRAGFSWMARLSSIEAGGVLADDMGLGKTVQALALLVHRSAEGPALVIAPTSVGDNWAREAARFAPDLRVKVHRGAGRAAKLGAPGAGDIVIASYDVVVNDVDALAGIDWATLIVDEAQAIKNPQSLRAGAVRRMRARARFALTGTPLENRLAELWSIFAVVHPGLLGSWEHFRARFAVPIEKRADRSRLEALVAVVRPYLLRRTKSAVAPELPERIEVMREVELGEEERRLYDAERARAIKELAGAGEGQRFAVLASITRLRQLACDASLVVPEAEVGSAKIDALIELLEEIEAAGGRALVFSQFTRLLERVSKRLRARGTRYLELDGSTPAEERTARVERFQAGEASVFLLSLKAGGVGLNLTAADHVVHLDPWWNPAVEDQASDRAHRIGQTRAVTIVRMVSKGTIEQAVLDLHETKRALTRGVLEGADAAGALKAEELLDLIRGS